MYIIMHFTKLLVLPPTRGILLESRVISAVGGILFTKGLEGVVGFFSFANFKMDAS